jgi:hypothetical protein
MTKSKKPLIVGHSFSSLRVPVQVKLGKLKSIEDEPFAKADYSVVEKRAVAHEASRKKK